MEAVVNSRHNFCIVSVFLIEGVVVSLDVCELEGMLITPKDFMQQISYSCVLM